MRSLPRESRRFAAARPAIALALALLAACGADPAGPGAPTARTDAADVPVEADFSLQVAADETVGDVVVEDAALWVGEGPGQGPWAEAAEFFRRARRAWLQGDPGRARALALEGRLVLARALIARQGEACLDALEDFVDIAIERLDEASDGYARADELRDRLAALREEAAALRAEDRSVAAAERLIFAVALVDRMNHRFVDGRLDAPAYAARAVQVAENVLHRVEAAVGRDPGPRVRHALGHATELLRRAEAALDRRAWRRAIVLARRSIGWSLHALRLGTG